MKKKLKFTIYKDNEDIIIKMTTTEENMDNQRLRLENDNQEDKKEENIQDIEKTEGNNLATEAEAEGGSSSSCIKPKILIPIIIAAVVVIVVVVVLVVVLTKDDDDEEEENNEEDDIGDIGDERWVEVYKKAKKFLEPFSDEDKYLLFYGDYNVDKT